MEDGWIPKENGVDSMSIQDQPDWMNQPRFTAGTERKIEMSDTPRTDNHIHAEKGIISAGCVSADFARQLERDLSTVCKRLADESQLACDLRNTQDVIIERCAKAIEDLCPEAAHRLVAHCGRPQDGAFAVSGEDFGQMQRDLTATLAQIDMERTVAKAVAEKYEADLSAAQQKIAELEKRANDGALKYNTLVDANEDLKEQLSTLRTALASSEADTRRLDKLDSYWDCYIGHDGDEEETYSIQVYQGNHNDRQLVTLSEGQPTLRATIDAALSPETK